MAVGIIHLLEMVQSMKRTARSRLPRWAVVDGWSKAVVKKQPGWEAVRGVMMRQVIKLACFRAVIPHEPVSVPIPRYLPAA